MVTLIIKMTFFIIFLQRHYSCKYHISFSIIILHAIIVINTEQFSLSVDYRKILDNFLSFDEMF